MHTKLFYFSTIKMKPLTTVATLFYFTTIKMKPLTTLVSCLSSQLSKLNL